jgi:hypothetical protein
MLVVAVAAAGLVPTLASTASADYPPGVGSLSASASDPAPPPGATVEISGTALDSAGQPTAGVVLDFMITSQPGGASFNGSQTATAVTDGNGLATVRLTTGSQPGTTVVRVASASGVTQVTVRTGEPQQLPRTGGLPAGDTSMPIWPALIGLGALAVIASGAGILSGKRRHSN